MTVTTRSAQEPARRWRGRPVASACLRFAAFTTPIGAAVAVGTTVARLLPAGEGLLRSVGIRALLALAASTVALVLLDRLARRLLPLAALLRLSLAFPDEAPSRLAVARAAPALEDLEARLAQVRLGRLDPDPARAATQILSLVAALEAHDRATRGHSERVRIFTDLVAEQMGLPGRDRDRLRWAALLHDVGKLEVPRRILNKPGSLNSREWDTIRLHPRRGARMIWPLRVWLGEWAGAVLEHHERWDGNGYPRGVAGDAISRAGRIVAVTDAFETMTARRPYKRSKSALAAREELIRCSGQQFDPCVVRAFLQISIRRLRWASGPLSWMAQSPLLAGLEHAGNVGRSVGTVGTVAAASGALTVGVAPVLPPPAPPPLEQAAAAEAAGDRSQEPDPDGVGDKAPDPRPSPREPGPDPLPTPAPTATGDPEPTPSPQPTDPSDPPRRDPRETRPGHGPNNPQPRPEPPSSPGLGAGNQQGEDDSGEGEPGVEASNPASGPGSGGVGAGPAGGGSAGSGPAGGGAGPGARDPA